MCYILLLLLFVGYNVLHLVVVIVVGYNVLHLVVVIVCRV